MGLQHIPNDCPDWDKDCGCHGPVMTRGMVAWAGGKTGPDFFIDAYTDPAEMWGTQHTVFGKLLPESIDLLENIWDLPVHEQNSMMTMLDVPVSFTMKLEIAEAVRQQIL